MNQIRLAVLLVLVLSCLWPDPALSATPMPTGREIYNRFREGLADPACNTPRPSRWRQHFAAAPKRLAARNENVLPLFAHVVDAVRAARLPTEYALIPFIESGYRPQARSKAGPAGLWQIIAPTARTLSLPVGKGVDGRMSPVDSTRAAVRYLATLHRRFSGNWRLAAMAYNTGENRVLAALRRSGQRAQDAEPGKLPGLSATTRSYVEKLNALSCEMNDADNREEWLRAIDRPVVPLQPYASAQRAPVAVASRQLPTAP